jgi:hypothetical protein
MALQPWHVASAPRTIFPGRNNSPQCGIYILSLSDAIAPAQIHPCAFSTLDRHDPGEDKGSGIQQSTLDALELPGRYRDQVAAAQAYDEAAQHFFGEHAWLNFPQGLDAWLQAQDFTTPSRAAA